MRHNYKLKIGFRWQIGRVRWVAIDIKYTNDVVDVIFVPRM